MQESSHGIAKGIRVEEVHEADPTLLDAINELLPQLSSSCSPLDLNRLHEIAESPATRLLLAWDDGKVVGSLTLVLFPIPTGRRAWIEDVVVDETCRGRGVGRKLTEVAIEIARAGGVKSIDLTSRPSRVAANGLYRSVGFIQRETNVYRYSSSSQADG